MIKILIADDHAVVRAGIKQVLGEQRDLKIVGEAASGLEALDFIRTQPLDLVMMDISMPGMTGLEALKEIKVIKPHLPVLILSMYAEDLYAVRALKAGASGYITKDKPMPELMEAIRTVAEGRKYIDSSFAQKALFDKTAGPDAILHESLSDREYQVMCLLASGKTVSEIAKELFLSVKTISTNRARIMKKMNMSTNAELTYYAVKHKLVE